MSSAYRPRWRYWAHRLGLIPSPMLTLFGVPYGRRGAVPDWEVRP